MGSGEYLINYDPVTKALLPDNVAGTFAQNRATLHLHGGKSPWISDGTPHQWTVPNGEVTDYAKGVSVSYVPDMWFNAVTGATITACAKLTTCGAAECDEQPRPRVVDVLLDEPAERQVAVLPRSRLGDHPPQRLRRRGGGIPDPGQRGAGDDERRDRQRPHLRRRNDPPPLRHDSPGHPGQDVRGRRHDRRCNRHGSDVELGDGADRSGHRIHHARPPATSGRTMSTCRPRILTTPTAE